jgi:hypothetical protein
MIKDISWRSKISSNGIFIKTNKKFKSMLKKARRERQTRSINSACTSVLTRVSFGGSFSFAFQSASELVLLVVAGL